MRLPFVGRSRFALAEHNLAEMRQLAHRAHESADSWKALYESERIRGDRLEAAMLRVKGMDEKPQQATTPVTPDIPAIVADALAESTKGLPREYKHAARAKAKALLADGQKPEDVAKIVREGERI